MANCTQGNQKNVMHHCWHSTVNRFVYSKVFNIYFGKAFHRETSKMRNNILFGFTLFLISHDNIMVQSYRFKRVLNFSDPGNFILIYRLLLHMHIVILKKK